MANLFWPKDRLLRSKQRAQRKRGQAWLAAAERAEQVLVLSHGHCLDGVTSAIVAQRSLEGVSVAYCQPSHLVKVLDIIASVPADGRSLLIADLSMQTRDFDAIVTACKRLRDAGWTISWFDHHHKQWEGIETKRLKEHLEKLVVDKKLSESGATLVQKAYAPRDRFLKSLAQKVRDRDLWWNEDPDSETLEFALSELGTDAFTAHYLAHDGKGPVADDHIQQAAGRERARQAREAGRILAGTQYFGEAPHKVGVVYGWLPKNTGLHDLLTDHDCAVAINVRPNGKMSIRSRKGADISHIVADAFKGGGHPNASGGDLGLSGPAYWWYVIRRGKVPVTGKVAQKTLEALQEGG